MTLEEARTELAERMRLDPLRRPRQLRKELEARLAESPSPLLERLHALVASVDMRTSPYYIRMIQACVVLSPELEPAQAHQLVDEVASTTKRFHLAR